MTAITRRRFIQLAAACGASAAMPACVLAGEMPIVRWQGVALGAEAQLTLAHPNKKKAQQTIQACLAEIDRLENIFSLYRDSSAISQLNRRAFLESPPSELTEVINIAVDYGRRSAGVFDITIQPLWQLYHAHFKQEGAHPDGPPEHVIQNALAKVDYRKITLSEKGIHLRPGMAITLNGIAQGYITDRIAELLKKEGFENALVNLGEYQALGSHPAGRSWQLGIPNPEKPWQLAKMIDVPAGKALATSGAYGTRWSEKAHHLLSAKTGRPVNNRRSVTVIADTAMQADALATLFALQPDIAVNQYPESQRIIFQDT